MDIPVDFYIFYAQKKHPKRKNWALPGLSSPIQAPRLGAGDRWIFFPCKDPGFGLCFFPLSKLAELFMAYLGGGGFKDFVMFTPKIGEDEPILTSIFFKGVGSTTNQIIHGGGVILTTY